MPIITRKFLVKGMVCQGCEATVRDAVLGLPGVKSAQADFKSGWVRVEFDPGQSAASRIVDAVESHGYPCSLRPKGGGAATLRSMFVTLLGLSGIAAILFFDVYYADRLNLPSVNLDTSYGLLFLVGLLTGFHCVGMCGGFIIGYTAGDTGKGRRTLVPHVAYGLGKTLSYTTFGALFGLLGSVIAFTVQLRAGAAVLAGLFLVLYGMKMLDLAPLLRHFGVRMPGVLLHMRKREGGAYSHPFAIGLMNGLMIACGPLQAMYVLAAASGSPTEGAKLLFLFGLGTLPVLFGFGFLASVISAHATHRLLGVSGYLVILLGAIMVNRGLAMAGSGYDVRSVVASLKSRMVDAGNRAAGSVIQDGYQVVYTVVKADGYHPADFDLTLNVPVKWVIEGQEITGCNRGIIVPKLGLEFQIEKGVQLIEFTPEQEGVIPWSCWMGMMEGRFSVHATSTDERTGG